jgi:peptidoglycan hydrolase-like protein with peptidoglycan-binding domain
MPDVEYISYNDLVPKDAAPATPKAEDAPFLRMGATGDAVKALQEQLNAHGELLAVTGNFGPSTHEAVRRLQLRNGLRPADGMVNAATQKVLTDTATPASLRVRYGVKPMPGRVNAATERSLTPTEPPVQAPPPVRKKLPPSQIPRGKDWFLASSQRVLPEKPEGGERSPDDANALLTDINRLRHFKGKG